MKHPKTTIKRAIGARDVSCALPQRQSRPHDLGHPQAATGRPVLTMGLTNYTATLNPAISGWATSPCLSTSDASLPHINPDGTISPALATSWRYVGTGNTTFESRCAMTPVSPTGRP